MTSPSLDERGVTDLFYDWDGWPEIKAKFPNAEREDASDFIHDARIQVKIPDASLREWYLFLLDSGWHGVSLGFQIRFRGDPKGSEFIEMVEGWVAAHKEKNADAAG
jgi:hypothetical protein